MRFRSHIHRIDCVLPQVFVTPEKLNCNTHLLVISVCDSNNAVCGLIALHIKFKSCRSHVTTVSRKLPSLSIRINASNLHFPQPRRISDKNIVYTLHKRIRVNKIAEDTRYVEKRNIFIIIVEVYHIHIYLKRYLMYKKRKTI